MKDDNPFKGLESYEEGDALYFFGRDGEREVITHRLLISCLTVIYGPSGVGKSSVLRAGVINKLRLLNKNHMDEKGKFLYNITVFDSWKDTPSLNLRLKIRDGANNKGASIPAEPRGLVDVLHE